MAVALCVAKFAEYAEELNDLRSIEVSEMLRFLIAEGSKLLPLHKEEFTEENYVKGCVSNAYLQIEEVEGKILMRGHSDAMVVKGFMAILSVACSHLTKEELAQEGKQIIQSFFDNLDLHIVLTPSRANAFGNVVQLLIKKGQDISA